MSSPRYDADIIVSAQETAMALELKAFGRRQSDTVPFNKERRRAEAACKRALAEFGRAVRGEQ